MKYPRILFYVFLLNIVVVSCNIEPYEGDIPDGPVVLTCPEAIQNSADAALAFSNATSENYAQACADYKAALIAQLNFCGDDTGTLQLVIDGLGDCGTVETNGNYWPMNVGNSWTYSWQVDGLSQDDSSLEIGSLVDYQGIPSYKYDNFFGSLQGTDGTGFENVSVGYYSRNANGDYEVLVDQLTAELAGIYRITQSAYNYTLLKDYLDAGSTWTYNFDVVTSYEPLQTGGVSVPDVVSKYDISLEILEKDVSVTTGYGTFSPVIKVGFVQNVSVVGLPTSNSSVNYIYYFAKDIGVIKVEGTIFDADDNITSEVLQELKTYTIN